MRSVLWSMLSILRWVWAENVTFEDKLEHPSRENPMNVRGAKQQMLGKDENPKSATNKLVFDPDFDLFCENIGDCHSCPASEKDEVHCVKSGYRQELSCLTKDLHMKAEPGKLVAKKREMKFKSCTPQDTTTLRLVRVFLFEMLMIVTLIGAVAALNKEKQNHLSRFDLRQDPRQRYPFLDPASNKNDD